MIKGIVIFVVVVLIYHINNQIVKWKKMKKNEKLIKHDFFPSPWIYIKYIFFSPNFSNIIRLIVLLTYHE